MIEITIIQFKQILWHEGVELATGLKTVAYDY